MEKILFYTSKPDEFATEITCTSALSTVHSIEFLPAYSHAHLVELLRTEPKDQLIALLIALSMDELNELVAIKQIFEPIQVVLILPDEQDSTLHQAHKLRPRFLSSVSHDFKYVLSVVEQLCEKLSTNYCCKE